MQEGMSGIPPVQDSVDEQADAPVVVAENGAENSPGVETTQEGDQVVTQVTGESGGDSDDAVVVVEKVQNTGGNTTVSDGGKVNEGYQNGEILDVKDEQPSTEVQRTESEFAIELQNAEQFLLDKEAELKALVDVASSVQEVKLNISKFDQIYQQTLAKLDSLKYDVNKYENSEEISQLVDKMLEVQRRIEVLRVKNDLIFLQNSNIRSVMQATSNQELEEALTTIETNAEESENENNYDPHAKDQVNRIRKSLIRAQELAGMSVDKFIELNEGSSVDTLFQFLFSPLDTNGKNGVPLRFGKKELGDTQAENISLPSFRSKLLSEPQSISKALAIAASKIHPDWAGQSENKAQLESIKTSGDLQATKDLLVKMYTELMVTSDKRDENKTNFRLHFGTALFNDGTDKYLNDASFSFFESIMKNNGEELDKLWKLKAKKTG